MHFTSNISASAHLPTAVIHGHDLLVYPGGLAVIGSDSDEVHDSIEPQWVDMKPFLAGRTAVTEERWHEAMGKQVKRHGYPQRNISWHDSKRYVEEFNNRHEEHLRLLTEDEWEVMARGPAVNLRNQMEEEGISEGDFVDWVAGRFENFVTAININTQIYTDPENKEFQYLLKMGGELFGWRVFSTPSGRMDVLLPEGDWRAGPLPAHSGVSNPYGAYHMSGGVLEWVGHDSYTEGAQQVLRGGSWASKTNLNIVAFRRLNRPDFSTINTGLRIARSIMGGDRLFWFLAG